VEADDLGGASIQAVAPTGQYYSSHLVNPGSNRWAFTDLTPATLNRYRSTLSMIYAEAMGNSKASSNPARLVRLRRENNARIRFLSFEEEQFLRDGIAQRTSQWCL
jgi:hypothetical protein